MKRRKLSDTERKTVYEKCNGHCAYCGCNLEYKDMQVDHVIPLNGYRVQGEDTLENMLPACRSCNHYRRSSPLENFRKAVENMPSVLMRDSVTYKNAVRFGLVHPDPHPVKFYFEVMDKKPSTKDTELADLEQAIEYFQNELSSINVFSDLVSFKEEEKKSMETALKVLRKALEDTGDGSRTFAMCDAAQPGA